MLKVLQAIVPEIKICAPGKFGSWLSFTPDGLDRRLPLFRMLWLGLFELSGYIGANPADNFLHLCLCDSQVDFWNYTKKEVTLIAVGCNGLGAFACPKLSCVLWLKLGNALDHKLVESNTFGNLLLVPSFQLLDVIRIQLSGCFPK